MVRYAVGYRSRAFVTFGEPIAAAGIDPHARRDVLELAHHIRDSIGRLMKVLPTMVMARRHAAVDRRGPTWSRASPRWSTRSSAAGANLATTDPPRRSSTRPRAYSTPAASSSKRTAGSACASGWC